MQSATAYCEHPEVDIAMEAKLDFAGVPGEVRCSMDTDPTVSKSSEVFVQGSHGSMTVVNPIAPHRGHHELRLSLGSETTTETVEGHSTYGYQLKALQEVIAGEAQPLTGGRDAINTMQTIDDIYRAAGLQPRGMVE